MRNLLFNEATLGGLLHGSWVRVGHQKDQAMIRSLEFLGFLPLSLEKEKAENRASDASALAMKPPQNSKVCRTSGLVKNVNAGRDMPRGLEAPHIFSHSGPKHLFHLDVHL